MSTCIYEQEMGNAEAQAKGEAKGNPNPVRDSSPESAPARELAAGRHGADHWDDLLHAWAEYLSQPQINGGHQPHHPNQQNHHRHHPGGPLEEDIFGGTPTDYGRSDPREGQGRSDTGMSEGAGAATSIRQVNKKASQRRRRNLKRSRMQMNAGDQWSELDSVQSGQDLGSGSGGGGGGGGGGHTHTGQKRKVTATATNGTADDGGECAAKRQKGNSRPSDQGAGAGEGGVAEPHPDFWHPDGSVIVEVRNTRFKLHQSTLQKHSAYFADAFREKEGHQSRNRTPLPVYRADETRARADDFASLLTVIEEPMCVFLVPF